MTNTDDDDFAALMSSLSNATGTECETLTIEMMQEAMDQLRTRTCQHADAARAAVDEALWKSWVNRHRVAAPDVAALTVSDRPEWLAPDGYQGEIVLTAKLGTFEFGTTLVTVMDRALALAFEDDIIAALGRIGGRRWRQGRARRVRMARKRRRGWA